MFALGVIPARYDSSRFPGKPLIDLKGKSMIQRVYEGALSCSLFNEVVVATDDQRIFDHVKSFGGQVQMTSKDHQSGTDRCGEVLSHYPQADLVVNIQGDEPLVDPKQLEVLIRAFENHNVDIATLGNPNLSLADLTNPNRIKLVIDKNQNALYFSRSAIPFGAKEPQEKWIEKFPYLRHIGLYAYRSKTLAEIVTLKPAPLEVWESLEQLRWLYNGYNIQVV
ncbi:MAG: 3-deoxy-manno-octulosonate cytidylyltransferase, partial [Gammaproteobacteria bacterium]